MTDLLHNVWFYLSPLVFVVLAVSNGFYFQKTGRWWVDDCQFATWTGVVAGSALWPVVLAVVILWYTVKWMCLGLYNIGRMLAEWNPKNFPISISIKRRNSTN